MPFVRSNRGSFEKNLENTALLEIEHETVGYSNREQISSTIAVDGSEKNRLID